MSLRVFQLAKELGVDSKVIVKKCKQKDIPAVDTHMSTLTRETANIIRRWFQNPGDPDNPDAGSPPERPAPPAIERREQQQHPRFNDLTI